MGSDDGLPPVRSAGSLLRAPARMPSARLDPWADRQSRPGAARGHGITGPLEEVAGAELLRDGGSQLPVGARAFRLAATLHLFLS